MEEAYIVEAVRTPIGRGRENGALASVHPVDALAHVLNACVGRSGVEKGAIDDIICGCVSPTGEQGANIPRLALLKAGFPYDVPAVQIDRMCGSSQQAVHFASQAIRAGDMDLVIAAGVEMMSRVPMSSTWGGLTKDFLAGFPFPLAPMGVCAERIAEEWNISREEMDQFSIDSHNKAFAASEAGQFESQIAPVTVSLDGETRIVSKDEGMRPNGTLEKMATLKTPFKEDGVVTAGTASQISDGAAAILIASGAKADELGLTKRARIVARVAVGSDPKFTLTGPIPATQKVLAKAGMGLGDMDIIEINEAFASVVLAWQREVNPPDMDRVNPNGGAIAMGHPLGATGAVLMTKLVNELERSDKQFGLQTMCIGHGQATATIIERVS